MLQQFQFGALFHGSLNAQRRVYAADSGQFVAVFVGQNHLAVHGQAALLAEQHARQRQSVLSLRDRHFSFVHFHADFQTVSTSCEALAYQLLHVLVQLCHQVEEAFG